MYLLYIIARTITAQQFNLQMIKRIDIRRTNTNTARQSRILLQLLGMPRDCKQPFYAALPFCLDAPKNLFAQSSIGDQFGIT
mgnify:CR=1 FL=1